ncbi:hypothetical protein SS50377_20901 [Spironucleus salmonicida]|uniref:Uncharacterized protein n=1 Tax=Spironucleus salmonicida TaxID=348837 RepID=V6LG91_9EUKA|nr:hypothetical protein SS50377_20901 [Spironucleus salmonicida]|eukprot:EST43575.1 Hypothetical protein SS50377_16616 [Spironucleus salmonicida]
MPTVSSRELQIENEYLTKIYNKELLELQKSEQIKKKLKLKVLAQNQQLIDLNIQLQEKIQQTTEINTKFQLKLDQVQINMSTIDENIAREQQFFEDNQEILLIHEKVMQKKEQLTNKIQNLYEQIELNYGLQQDYDTLKEQKMINEVKDKIKIEELQKLAGLVSRELLFKNVEVKEVQQKQNSYLEFDYL